MSPASRGVRPKGPGPWPRKADGYRQDMEWAAEEINRLVGLVFERPGENPYKTKAVLAQIDALAQQIRRHALEAKHLGGPGEAEDVDLATLVRDEVARQLAELGVSPANVTPIRKV